MFGRNQRGGLSIGILTETFAGAGGARHFGDGVDIGGEIPNPISRMANVETIEATFPIRYLFRKRLQDSGGAGRHRGGTGGEMAIVAHDAPDGGIHYVVSGKGSKFPQSEGLAGGYPGAVNDYVWVKKATPFAQGLKGMGDEAQPVTWGVFPLMGPDALYVRWNGGGGIGDPLQRDPARVLTDVIQNTVSERAAADLYGVVIRNGAVDAPQTEARRRSLRDNRVTA